MKEMFTALSATTVVNERKLCKCVVGYVHVN